MERGHPQGTSEPRLLHHEKVRAADARKAELTDLRAQLEERDAAVRKLTAGLEQAKRDYSVREFCVLRERLSDACASLRQARSDGVVFIGKNEELQKQHAVARALLEKSRQIIRGNARHGVLAEIDAFLAPEPEEPWCESLAHGELPRGCPHCKTGEFA